MPAPDAWVKADRFCTPYRCRSNIAQKPGFILQVHTDHLGSPRAVSEGVTVLWRWEGDAFGNTAANEDVDADTNLLTMPLRFPGQYKDPESGLNYNYFRDYNPATGRYVQSDPIGLIGGLNTYGYVGASPLMYYDPEGKFAIFAPLILALGEISLPATSALGGAAFLSVGAMIYGGVSDSAAAGSGAGAEKKGWPTTKEEECKGDDPDCARERAECLVMCAEAAGDTDRKHVYGGSMAQCMLNCLPVKCGGARDAGEKKKYPIKFK